MPQGCIGLYLGPDRLDRGQVGGVGRRVATTKMDPNVVQAARFGGSAPSAAGFDRLLPALGMIYRCAIHSEARFWACNCQNLASLRLAAYRSGTAGPRPPLC